MNSEIINQTGNAEFAEIEAEISELESYFGDLGLDDDDQETSSDEFSELNVALAGSEFASESAETSGALTFIEIADGASEGMDDQQEFGWPNPSKYVTKKLAKKWIKWCLKFVKRVAKFRSCAPKLAFAVASYKREKYGTALKQAYSAAKCIKSKL
ncbi:hypothetical protein MNBD_GAMMA04-103 [hydrothermal vent metagenome]|uniref:Uncharacterized protein n=1 Tax=hydrothermal vent metagenome TaxID=652676 RepID=A0A3B0WG24_9ZZZZ